MDSIWPSKVEKWLSGETQWFIDKLWQVVVEIEAERALLGRSRFAIPLDRFKNKNQDLETVRKILINLDSKEFLTIGRVLTPKGQRSVGFIEEPIEADEKGIFYDSRAEIGLTHGFKYLYKWLEQKQHARTDDNSLDKQAIQILSQFTGANLNLVIRALKEIRSSVEFALDGEASYEMQSGFASAGAVREKQLVRKLEALGLFEYIGEDIITNLISLKNLNLPLIDNCIEVGEQKPYPKIDSELEQDKPNSANDVDRKLEAKDFNWDSNSDEKRGTLALPDNSEPLIFWGGNFGGINELIKNVGHDCKRQQLKEAIAKYKQGESKNAKEINVSKWLSELKRKRPEFFKYFKVEYSPPDNYRLVYLRKST